MMLYINGYVCINLISTVLLVVIVVAGRCRCEVNKSNPTSGSGGVVVNNSSNSSNGSVHSLANSFYFFYMPKRPKNTSDYLNGLQMIGGGINTVEDFWSYYSHMIRPVDEFSSLSDIYLFKEGIRPVWEDPENQNGGKFVIKVRRNYTSKWWEDLLLAFVGEQIDGGDTINGIVISFRTADNSLIGIWNKDCNDNDSKERIAASLRNLFRIEKVDYKPHFYRITKDEAKEGDELNGLNSSVDGLLMEEYKQQSSNINSISSPLQQFNMFQTAPK
ncbi:hypothetical protein PPL_03199 [Heterostelium album PN500]|uniref:Eukaryotic translation initiation factor 4E n=1 Tax=Heterostelium pallidum (strain ATCC 26659 / Pp 5 / PN500) TaxID=670386 RepID=D3B478_HETP5|nr:hypothetical protein PPL_03199 [Heterostelium album PN500]EFA84126.1 hypothetical protein PPL_03199 [Heterostelium album PN500]|eukprot:XP_020436243.1 hypothetical protein PPL_03199 [Heterostelium album PN500]